MPGLILIVLFVFCLGIAAAAILVGRQLIATYDADFHRFHFYYLAAFYAFAFYGIWAQIIARALLSSFEGASAVVETIASFLPVLGVPFLFVSWLMLINLAHSMFGAAARGSWVLAHSIVFMMLLIGALIVFSVLQTTVEFVDTNLAYFIAAAIIALELAYFAAFLVIALRGGRAGADEKRKFLRAFSLMLFGAFVTRTAAGGLILIDSRLVVIAILVYFASNLAPLLYIRARSDRVFEPIKVDAPAALDFEQILERYGITKREKQIVEQICLGKTNQQIADSLFITLQTVKDHTHRVYSKIGVNSRVQLVQLINAAQSHSNDDRMA